ncbi:MAG TPA: PrsW family glutamic-type intramembrane protease [Gemmatimonadaceae bacterium]|nr:PrsW family glutamic-type intramembrane protease [Gemmatimonadaceae bacterium]
MTNTVAARGAFVMPSALQLLSWVGLAISLMTLAIATPKLVEEGGGASMILGNIAQYGWTIALLLVIFARTRTIGARALTGAALGGFFGVSSLAVLVGKPLVDWLGQQSVFVMTVFAPVTEELLKLMPVAIFLLLAMRSKQFRPSIGDAVLFGTTVACGMSMYENILYARGTDGGWLANLPFSPALPFLHTQGSMLVGGHVVYTALASLGLAVTIIYGGRVRLARFAFPVTLAIAIFEHMTVDRLVLVGSDELGLFARFSLLITLWGYLSTLLLVAGVVVVAVFETRVMRRGASALPASLTIRDIIAGFTTSSRWASVVQLSKRLRYESLRRSSILAASQTERSAPDASAMASVQRSYRSAELASGVAA